MTIRKANFNKKDITHFKKQYSNGEIETQTLSNIFYYTLSGEFEHTDFIKQYLDFWFNKEKQDSLGVVQLLISSHTQQVLKEIFGEPDFTFKGNRVYKNYIFQYDELLFFGSTQLEVVINEKQFKNIQTIEKIFIFNQEFNQLIINSISSQYEKLQPYEKNALNLAIENNILNKQFQFILNIPQKNVFSQTKLKV